MDEYRANWITPQLGVGYAPMSYAELDSLRVQGVDAIVNLCAEFSDLHEIEEGAGFDVYHFPIDDERAPDMAAMEKALEWLDEAIYLGKKVLVHCRHGIGRTGTFVTAYFLRKGFSLKAAEKSLRPTGATPSSYGQWRLLRKYGRQEGILTAREPSLERGKVVDLGPYFAEYEALVRKVEDDLGRLRMEHAVPLCGRETDRCCREYGELTFIETVHLNSAMNRLIRSGIRTDVIAAAAAVERTVAELRDQLGPASGAPQAASLSAACARAGLVCPLSRAGACILFEHRPIRCRCAGLSEDLLDTGFVRAVLDGISRNLYFALSGAFLEGDSLSFSIPEAVSGRFVERYFRHLARRAGKRGKPSRG